MMRIADPTMGMLGAMLTPMILAHSTNCSAIVAF
jgi:hypothetical protein